MQNCLMLLFTDFHPLCTFYDAVLSKMEQFLPALAKNSGATAKLKAADQMVWVGLINACRNQAEEIIMSEIIYS